MEQQSEVQRLSRRVQGEQPAAPLLRRRHWYWTPRPRITIGIGAVQIACGTVAAATGVDRVGRVAFGLMAAAGAGQVLTGVLTLRRGPLR